MRRLRTIGSDERGVSLAEMLMGMFVFAIVFGAILTMVEAAMHNQDRVAKRVYANQKARPALTGIIDSLHSSCVAPGIAPVLVGSTGNSITFLSEFGDDVSPIPDKRTIYMDGSAIKEIVEPGLSGAPGSWSFGPASSPRTLIEGVSLGSVGSPAVSPPLFRYYKYVSGQIDTTPLAVPLDAERSAITVLVEVAFAVSPGGTPSSDPTSKVTLTDSTTLRLEPASEDSAERNLPCV